MGCLTASSQNSAEQISPIIGTLKQVMQIREKGVVHLLKVVLLGRWRLQMPVLAASPERRGALGAGRFLWAHLVRL